MQVIVIEPPAPVVTLDEAKRHLIVEGNDDNTLIESLIAAACGWLDGPAGWLGRALGMQVLEWQSCEWPCSTLDFPFPEQLEIISVAYVDRDGVVQTWALPDPVPSPLYFENMPAVRGRSHDVRIRYRVGYATQDQSDPPKWINAAPAPVKTAILMLVAQWYRTREPIAIDATVESLPFAVEALLSPYRVYR